MPFIMPSHDPTVEINICQTKVPVFEIVSHLKGIVNMEMVYIVRFAVVVKELAEVSRQH